MEEAAKNPKDKWIPWYFVLFFVVIAILDGSFVYMAVSTQTGVVTEQPYEKGLAYNDVLEKAKTQPKLENKASYSDGVLRWALPIKNASVTATIIRPVQDGYDFDVVLVPTDNGIYEARIKTPLKGLWTAKLKAKWDNQEFQTTHDFIAR